jgi:Domain of unknown function (DUF2017)
VSLFRRSRFTPVRGGGIRVRLDPTERAVLAGLPDELDVLLADSGGDEPGLVRLFPPAYVDDRELDDEYHRLMRDELVRRRIEAVATLRRTVMADELTQDELHAWVKVLNDVRLVLGTVLDVSEDTDVLDIDPESDDATQRIIYYVLSGIVDDGVQALTQGLPPPTVAD